MQQDFSKKMIIILEDNLKSWQLTNTIGHISAYLGNKINDKFLSGDFFKTKDNILLPRNSQYPIVTFIANENDLKNIAEKIKTIDISHIIFIQDMIDMSHDEELGELLNNKDFNELKILGIGLFGDKEYLKGITKGFKLYK